MIDHYRHPNRWHYIPQAITPGQTSSPVSTHPCLSISGWLLCVSSSIGNRLRPWCDSFHNFCCCPNHHPNDGTTSPHMLQPPRALSPISLLLLSSISGWLLCVLLSFGHKANSLLVSLIFEGSLYGTQNRGTNYVERKPGAGRLASVLW